MRGVKLLHGLGVDRVERVGDQRRRRDDRDHLIQQVRRVLLQRRPVTRRLVGEEHDLVTALAQRQEQRPENGDDQQPVADRNVDDHRPGRRTKHEPDRDREDVDDDDVLQRP